MLMASIKSVAGNFIPVAIGFPKRTISSPLQVIFVPDGTEPGSTTNLLCLKAAQPVITRDITTENTKKSSASHVESPLLHDIKIIY